jgi:hypothetical protein
MARRDAGREGSTPARGLGRGVIDGGDWVGSGWVRLREMGAGWVAVGQKM